MTELERLRNSIREADSDWKEKAWERLRSQIRPRGSLGYLEEIAARLAAIQGTLIPDVSRKIIFTMAGDHGVAEEGVSAYPQEVTAQMVYSFTRGWASINVLASHAGADVRVVDCGVAADLPQDWPVIHGKIGHGTANMAQGPAMTREAAAAGILLGAGLVERAFEEEGYRLFGTGDMGIANTTASTAIVAAFSGKPVAELTGRGTGIDDQGWARKVEVIERALAVNRPDPEDPLDVLSKVGGYEIAALAGAVLGAAKVRAPVVCDGFIATAGALVACRWAPAARDYVFLSHRSREVGHGAMIDLLGIRPILDLDMRLGEGTGSALAMNIVDAAARVLKDIKTFEEAGVTDTGH
ncbi:nicotinate-nucleotide--dimethylbenzimidazole phosphoribosyltransferase [Desulfoglaeba alkanexedens]|jgi:nicotinate-nucleotide--dimethylbenzimidazole phosphoribosyltransferase|uniref:Nicotinate-nucleotide--dimethylbenzimidazole phosphoribosyltransferase n=1 Tax=Desulfoglaeba alkanexedens ALDC TaxID=980445 RepID=A0A4V1ERG8_9BACT|nr:nicotinate-nucleotide--dimethylbenzimidazole phosphoribosyltransferase [Desulfoglaeba alkanexedens]QCQ21591.1 nicotinate-nucleotide--dimethylbenzimidazole phosphoribosyltransferase [Desulfoglaeba alkanexedens ALDC]